jgi:hypothetical protein
MKKTLLVIAGFLLCYAIHAQKADFRAAEKFRSDNIASRYGDLSVNPTWIEESDLFWYSYKTSSGKNFYLSMLRPDRSNCCSTPGTWLQS